MVTPTPTTVQVKIQLRRDTAANWTSVNPVLLAGEMGLETTTNKIKVGDGSTAWNSLGYFPFVISGGTVTGNLEIGSTGTLTFEGSTADGFETTLGVINPTADRTINLPNVSGTIITTGDTGTVTSTMIADGTIVNGDISASAAIAHSKLANITAGYVLIGNASNVPTATQVTGDVTISNTGVTAISSGVIVDADVSATAEIAVSKLANGTANQVIVTDGTNVSWSDDLTLAGNLTVNGTTTTINTQDLLVEDKNIIIGNVDTPTDVTADGGGITLKGTTDKLIIWSNATDTWASSELFAVPAGSAAAPSLTFLGDENTGIYSPGANQVAISTNGTGRLFINSNGDVGIGAAAGTARNFALSRDITGNPTARAYTSIGNIKSDVTNVGAYYSTFANTEAASFTLANLRHYTAIQGSFGAGSTVTNQIGYVVESSLIGATNNYGFYGDIASGTGRYNFFANGTARNHFAGETSFIGSVGAPSCIITSAGLVGVGTSAPTAKLQINAQDGLLFDSAGSYSYMRFGSAATGESSAELGYDRTNGSIHLKQGNTGSAFATRFTINSAGNVGIGVTDPGSFRVYTTTAGAYAAAFVTERDQSNNPSPRRIILSQQNFRPSIEAQQLSTTWDPSPLLINPSGGNVGIGTTSPGLPLHVIGTIGTTPASSNSGFLLLSGNSGAAAGCTIESSFTSGGYGPLLFKVNNGEAARIDSSGRLLVGTSTSTENVRYEQNFSFVKTGANTFGGGSFVGYSGTSAEYAPLVDFKRSRGTTDGSMTVVASGDRLGGIAFLGADGNSFEEAANIRCYVDGTPGDGDMPGRLVFSTTPDSGSSPVERVRITQAGYLKATDNATYNSAADFYHELRNSTNNRIAILSATNASYAEGGLTVNVHRAANSAYQFFDAFSGNFGDLEFRLLGDGNGRCDGAWTGGGADYAEYFEWSDSNPDAEDRRGISVVLDGDKIREAQAGEDPIGVISGNPSVVGDAAWNKWSGKYLRDEFGTYIQEDYEVTDDDGNTVIQQRRKLNPAYDPDVEYVSREQRPEWDCVGLMGKLRIRKGQVTGFRWIKMRDISDSVEEWLVR